MRIKLLSRVFPLMYKDFATSRLWTLKAFVTPLSFPLFYLYVGGFIYQTYLRSIEYKGVNVPYTIYLAMGMVIIQIYQGANINIVSIWTDIKTSMLQQYKYMGWESEDYFLSKVVASSIISIFYGFFLFILILPIFFYTGFFPSLSWISIMLFFFVVILAGIFFISYYFLIAVCSNDISTYNLIVTSTLFPLMFLSSVFYPINMIPHPWNLIFYWNPLSVFARMIRDSLLLNSTNLYDLLYIFIITILIFLLAHCLFKNKFNKI